MKLLITDLDNTLYDWVTFFARSFQAMLVPLVTVLGESEETLLAEFKALHQQYGTTEPPFALLELPAVKRKFGALSRQELKARLNEPIRAFNTARDQHLVPYPGVAETLRQFQARGTLIVGHTEAIAENALFRLRKLSILKHFKHLYVLESALKDHPIPGRRQHLAAPEGLLRFVPESERKPHPRLLLDICTREGIAPAEAVYVGDSLARDITMAQAAGITAVWARYGLEYDPVHWGLLKRISHWRPEDVVREESLRQDSHGILPDQEIRAFAELLEPRSSRPSFTAG